MENSSKPLFRKGPLFYIGLFMVIGGTILFIYPFLRPSPGTEFTLSPVQDPGKFGQFIQTEASGIANSVGLSIAGSFLFIGGMFMLVFSGISQLFAGIFSSLFGNTGHGALGNIFHKKSAVKCPGCGAKNPADLRECKYCGTAL